ncbi:hypothetical protein EFK68_04080 [Pseudomonas aeruginosa]|uniref:hypothetical protein n=1 Tax=Pseudomonas aeruginosa TaxID=287 RepID=UPI00093DD4BF|nr:hypothetical protein [Pseudomonas aeruginosa]RNF58551.1 hypothetical protein EFK68_04080 [Pseudomonas aeruginosa]
MKDNNVIHLQNINPALELSHYEEIIEKRRAQLFGEMDTQGFNKILLLDVADRPEYIKCKAAVAQLGTLETMASRGVKTPEDLREHIQLVHELSAVLTDITAAELRTYSLDLLRSMDMEMRSQRTA